MSMINNDWLDAISPEFSKDYYKKLYTFVKDEYSKTIIYPPAEDIFNAFHFTPLSKVKVLLLGQDPYHNENQAHGLSFSVLPSQHDIPPSLQNIYKELHEDCGCYIPNNGYLKKWADQGVLLLNTVLTVRAHGPIGIREEVGKILQMQLFRLLMHRTDLLYTCSGEDRHKVKSQCLLIQSILYLQHLIQVRSQHTEAFLAVNISAKLMNF